MITIRPADASDLSRLFEWRNDPQTRASSKSTDPVEWAHHEHWFETVVASADHRVFVAERGADAVGMVRFDVAFAEGSATSAEVSINLNPAFRGQGLGLPVLEAALDRFCSGRDAPLPLDATIRPDNAASIRLFESLGFVETGSAGGFLHFERPVQELGGA